MSKEKFVEVLKEYGFNDTQIELIWDKRPSDNLNEQTIRKVAARMKDTLIQA